MNRNAWLGALLVSVLILVPARPAAAANLPGLSWWGTPDLDRLNHRIGGHVFDYTHNHGANRRIWSAALGQRRDLYVYVPPGFDPQQRYPLIVWLHGFAQDEKSFLQYVVEPLDRTILAGQLPPVIVAAPDGSISGEPDRMRAGSFFLNSKAGAFEDFVMQDVWNFVLEHYPIRPEREAHVLAGVSMGGGAAYNLAIKYRDRFKVVVGFYPPLNTRWLDCHGHYFGNFDPCCWGWRTDFSNGNETVGRFYLVYKIPLKDLIEPLYGRGPQVAYLVSLQNPIEMIDRLDLREGQLSMYVAYGGKDQFNIDAQVESFLYRARQRGLTVTVGYSPRGRHNIHTARRLFPGMVEWLAPQLAPYALPLEREGGVPCQAVPKQ